MKALFVTSVLAIALATGCTTGSTGKPVITETVAEPPAAPTAEVTPNPTTRIDAVAFIAVLQQSGCTVSKAEYKEVARGAGISVSCATPAIPVTPADPLNAEGINGL